IEELIKSGHLRKFIEDAAQGQVVVPKQPNHQQRSQPDRDGESSKSRIAVNTIARGFSGGARLTPPESGMQGKQGLKHSL
ncbi:hypothetical protein A2U01_0085491, partial [Trifolium medium]|nr:hypothetical protein [Trifolium medium]